MVFSKTFFRFGVYKAFFGLFLTLIILRIHTFFIAYYGRDEIVSTVYGYLNQDWGGDFSQKGFLFTAFFNLCYRLFGYTPVGMHVLGLLIIFLTCIFIYKTAQIVYKNSVISFISAASYGIFLSFGNQEIIEINGEFLINFFFALGFFALAKIIIDRSKWYFIPFLFFVVCAYKVKFQGVYLILPLLFYGFIILHRTFLKSPKNRRFFFTALPIFFLLFLIFIFYLTRISPLVHQYLFSKFSYIIVKFRRDLGWWLIFVKPLHRYAMLTLYAIPLWVGAFIHIKRILKKPLKSRADLFLASIFFALILTPFSAGIALYFHYFILLYIPLSLCSAVLIYEWMLKPSTRKLLFYSTVPFMLISFLWFTKDIFVLKYKKDIFYDYYKEWNFLQVILLGGNNDYLLPDPYIKETLKLTRRIPKTEPVFIFGQAGELAYFSKLLNVSPFWLDLDILEINTPLLGTQKMRDLDSSLLRNLKRSSSFTPPKVPLWFVDISQNPTNGLGKFGSNLIAGFPRAYLYLRKNFTLVASDKQKKIFLWKKIL